MTSPAAKNVQLLATRNGSDSCCLDLCFETVSNFLMDIDQHLLAAFQSCSDSELHRTFELANSHTTVNIDCNLVTRNETGRGVTFQDLVQDRSIAICVMVDLLPTQAELL